MYCVPAQLVAAKLVTELAQIATPERYRIVADDLMEATLLGEDRSAFDAADIEAADRALDVIESALVDASAVIDGFLVLRKPVPYNVPLNPVPGIVAVWARWIARYMLHKDRINTQEAGDPVVRDYRQAIKFLELIRDGKFSLGADDPLPPSSAGAPQVVAPARQFTADTLRDY